MKLIILFLTLSLNAYSSSLCKNGDAPFEINMPWGKKFKCADGSTPKAKELNEKPTSLYPSNNKGSTLGITKLIAGPNKNCVIKSKQIHCWGRDSELPDEIKGLKNVTDIAIGAEHFCAISDDKIHCWGKNRFGQFNYPNIKNIKSIEAGSFHTCAMTDSNIYCWGMKQHNLLNVPKLNKPHKLTIGPNGYSTCAIDMDGVKCWGANYSKQLKVPKGFDMIDDIYSGSRFHCANKSNKITCWGAKKTIRVAPSPNQLKTLKSLSFGERHSCGINEQGIFCTGDNKFGQTKYPKNLKDPISISVGTAHSCVLASNGVACWGLNSNDQTDVPNHLFQSMN